MEHLPQPKQPLLSPVTIPYTCQEPYDGGPVLYYPQRHGWEVHYSPFGISYRLNGEVPTNEELTRMIQNWLYFGVIDEIFAGLVDGEDFIRETGDGEKVVTTEKLEGCCAKWQAGSTPLSSV